MSIAQSATLLELIRQARLLDDTQVADAALLARRHAEGRELARELVRRGWLTPWQANEIAHGRGPALTLGNYVLLELLGQGNMGRVFKARQRGRETDRQRRFRQNHPGLGRGQGQGAATAHRPHRAR
jgi:hypothetical protein